MPTYDNLTGWKNVQLTPKMGESQQTHDKEQRMLPTRENMDTEKKHNGNGLTEALPQDGETPQKLVDRPMMERTLQGLLQNKIILSKVDMISELNNKPDK